MLLLPTPWWLVMILTILRHHENLASMTGFTVQNQQRQKSIASGTSRPWFRYLHHIYFCMQSLDATHNLASMGLEKEFPSRSSEQVTCLVGRPRFWMHLHLPSKMSMNKRTSLSYHLQWETKCDTELLHHKHF